jgi:molecular chaperone GrpE
MGEDKQDQEMLDSQEGKLSELKLQEELEALKRQLAEKEAIIKDYENLLKKIQADFDNYRKRVEREREEYAKLVNERIMKKLLNVIDDLERGLRDSAGNGGYEAFKAGVEKIKNNTLQILSEEGLREIPTDGTFDPYYHEAIVVEENPDCKDNEILEVYQKGYTLGGKVIRPAKVRVARKVERNLNEKKET